MNARLAPLLGGVLLVALAAAACGSSGSSYSNPMSPSVTPSPSPTPSPVGATLTIRVVAINGALSFSPNPSSIYEGETVAFYNADSTVHIIAADGGAFATGNLAPGATSAAITMADAGAYGYHCTLHPTMVGTLNVASQ
jgi:plastocyanin